MKLPFKYIAILVIVSLAGIFAYQAYWLTGLYHTMHSEMERDITEAMRMSDYNEMMIRVDKMKQDDINHGEVSVSAGYSDDGKSFVRSSTTISREDSLDNTTLHETFMPKGDSVYVTHPNDSTRVEVSVRDSDSSPQSALSAKGGLDVILRDQNSMLELATYFQRGLHSGLDIISDPDVLLYDSLLTSFLHDRNINLPHRLLHLHKGSKWDSTILYIDTLVNIGTPGYVPTSKAVEYNYSFDINTSQSYRLIMEPAGTLVLRQMSGILTTSFVILIVLAFSFWFLIRTILKQKTLEEMKKRNEEKAKILYDFLDSSKLFHGTVVPKDRSLMNVPFVTGDKEMDAKFVAEAAKAGLVNLKGHRTVGGMRASIYNAMPKEGVEKLVEFMKKFEEENA